MDPAYISPPASPLGLPSLPSCDWEEPCPGTTHLAGSTQEYQPLTPTTSGHISAKTWSLQAHEEEVFTPLGEKTMQSFCTYREGIPHQVTQGPLSISEQIWVPEPLPRAQSPCCRLPACRQVPTHTSEPRRFRSPRRRFTSLQANLTQTQSPFSQMHCVSRVHPAWAGGAGVEASFL